jgi:hypothetical protein
MKKIIKLVACLSLTIASVTTYAQPMIAGLGGAIEDTDFSLVNNSANTAELAIKLYDPCETCPEVLILSPRVKISYQERQLINPKSLKQNRTYTADLISYDKKSNTAHRIILSKD